MIIFKFSDDLWNGQKVYWLGCTSVTKDDEEHEVQIYEQLDAEIAFNL